MSIRRRIGTRQKPKKEKVWKKTRKWKETIHDRTLALVPSQSQVLHECNGVSTQKYERRVGTEFGRARLGDGKICLWSRVEASAVTAVLG